MRTAALVAAAVSLLILYMCRADVKKILPQTYQVAVGIVLIPTAGSELPRRLILISVFVQFHNIFFDNDLWRLIRRKILCPECFPKVFFMIWHSELGSLFAGIL